MPEFTDSDNTKSNFSFSFKNRTKETQIIQFGNEIYNLVNSVKEGGILIFFQSYDYLNICHTIWLDKEIIKKLEKLKKTIFDLNITKNKNEEDIIKAKKKKIYYCSLFIVEKILKELTFQMMKLEWLFVLEYHILTYLISK